MADLFMLAGAASGEGAHHAVPSALGLNPTAWVALSMAVFIGILLWKKVPGLIAGMLDGRIAEIRKQLDEAKALRAEAEALRAEYQAKVANADQEAAAVRAQAESEAAQLIADAETGAADLVARRGKMAEDKIAAAERAALADLRATAANAATEAARSLIAGGHGVTADKALVDKAIKSLN